MDSDVSGLSARDTLLLVFLASLWGLSFLFLRIAAPEFGPLALIELRLAFAFLVLFPVFLMRGRPSEILEHWQPILIVSSLNMVMPFLFFAYTAMHVTAGMTSILNATVPFFTALIGFFVFSARLGGLALFGLVIGFLGVALIVIDPSESVIQSDAFILAVLSGLMAAACYGGAANFTNSRLQGVSGLSITVGGLLFGMPILAPLAYFFWPDNAPGVSVWLSVAALGGLCTGVAYVLFYGLIGRIGPNRAVTVTFLVPPFSMAWGALILGESITYSVLVGGLLVLSGVAMTTGKWPRWAMGPFRN